MSGYDPRVTAARPDLAAEEWRGKIPAARYVAGEARRVALGVLDLLSAPSPQAGLHTQLLFGETFTVYDEKDGWAWGQAASDRYVGYLRAEALKNIGVAAAHRVAALSTPLLTAADVKKPRRFMLPLGANLAIIDRDERFVRLEDGFVFAGHVRPIEAAASDWVAIAERFAGVPYLWGGKTASGLDCSGLIQIALAGANIAAPRDTDMMEAALGVMIDPAAPLRRGDLVFWKGHIGVMQDETRLLHANAFFMEVTSEPLARAIERIAPKEGAIRTVKRQV